MPLYRKIVPAVAWTVGALCMFYILQKYFAFNFYYAEQWRMFRFSSDYAADTLPRVCGGATYMASFLLQFFAKPYVGAAVTTVIYICSALLLRSVLCRLAGKEHSHPLLYLLPSFFFIWADFDEAYHFEAGLAYVLAIALLALHVRVRRFAVRCIVAYVLSWISYWLVGPMALIYPIGVVLIEIAKAETDKQKWAILPLMLWCFVPALTWQMSGASDVPLKQLLTPAAYWHPLMEPPLMMWIAPCWALAVVLIALLLGGRKFELKPKLRQAVWSVEVLVVVIVFWRGSNYYHSPDDYFAKQIDYYAATSQWDSILNMADYVPSQNYLYICYQNLALASTNRLGDNLYDVPQGGPRGLWPKWNKMAPASAMLSRVSYGMGNVALAQALAFEGMIGSERAQNPRFILMLAKTNLINGQYRVAEKYISLLEQTACYADEAARLRRFLYNDKLVAADSEFGPLRLCTQKVSGLTNEDRAPLDLWPILQSNPHYRPAAEYYGAICLMMKDLDNFEPLVSMWHTAYPSTSLPKSFQEALLVKHEKASPDSLQALGVSQSTLKRFNLFKTLLRESLTDPMAAEKLKSNFANTYWFYYTFNKIR